MTVFSIKQNSQDNEKLQEVFKVVPELKVYLTRNSKIDGRIGCGLGYNVKLQVGNRTYSTKFNNSKAEGYKIPHPEGIIYCILSDAHCYECTGSFEDFCDEFGYDRYTENRYGDIKENKEAMRAFNTCERTHIALNRLFTSEQIEQLDDIFQDY